MSPRAQRSGAALKPARVGRDDATAKARALEHELQVHQTELEMQNEELRRAHVELSTARDRFVDLYDFAPVGYVTLDADDRIVEANLTAAALLGPTRQALLGRRFSGFLAAHDADRWRHHRLAALKQDGMQRIELPLKPRDGHAWQAQIDCLRVAGVQAKPALRITLSDITPRQLADMDRRIAVAAIESREAERRGVARELHEELAQQLSALKMNLSGLPVAARQAPRVDAMLIALDDALATVRRIVTGLRPPMLDDLGLNAAIENLAQDATRRLGLAVTLRLDKHDPPLDERASVALYRLLQDALSQLARESAPAPVQVELKQRPNELRLVVRGAGRTFTESSNARASSAMPLHQHAHMLGADLSIDQAADGAARLTLRLPLAPGAAAPPGPRREP